MSELELSSKTVIELRKLAKELHVPLSAGISKQGIVEKLAAAMAENASFETADAPETPSASFPEQEQPQAEVPAPAEVKAEPASEPAPVPPRPAPVARFNTKPAYQASSNRGPARPAQPVIETQRTQTTRPVSGFTPRFGPTATVEAPREARDEEPRSARPEARPAPVRPSFQSEPTRSQRPVSDARPAFETKPAFEARPAYAAPRREAPAPQSSDAAPSVSEMLTAAECLDGAGILELHPEGYGFLRSDALLPSGKDIYLSMAQVKRFGLRNGDKVCGKTRPPRDGDKVTAMLYVTEVNGVPADDLGDRPSFDELTAVYPTRRIDLATGSGDMLRQLDKAVPMGFGQRGLIRCAAQTDTRQLLADIADAIRRNHPDAAVMLLRCNDVPEEVTLLRERVDCPVLATTFDMPPEHPLRLTDLLLERAERLAEAGQDVVLLADSLTSLTKVFTAAAMQQNRPAPGAANPTSIIKAKKFFGAARSLREGGSLTILAVMNTDSPADAALAEEFAAAANMNLVLRDGEAELSIDPDLSGTRRAELLTVQDAPQAAEASDAEA